MITAGAITIPKAAVILAASVVLMIAPAVVPALVTVVRITTTLTVPAALCPEGAGPHWNAAGMKIAGATLAMVKGLLRPALIMVKRPLRQWLHERCRWRGRRDGRVRRKLRLRWSPRRRGRVWRRLNRERERCIWRYNWRCIWRYNWRR